MKALEKLARQLGWLKKNWPSVLAFVVFCTCLVFFFTSWGKSNEEKIDVLFVNYIGTGASIAAFLVIFDTLRSQIGISKKSDIHNLVETFNSRQDQLFIFLQSEASFNGTTRKRIEYLKENWDRVQSYFDTISVNGKYRFGVLKQTIDEIQKLAIDDDFAPICGRVERLLIIRNELFRLDFHAGSKIDREWNTLPQELKAYAGFHFVWGSYGNESFDLWSENRELIQLFSQKIVSNSTENRKMQFPDALPLINVSQKGGEFEWSKDSLKIRMLNIESECKYNGEITSCVFVANRYQTKSGKEVVYENDTKIEIPVEQTVVALLSTTITYYELLDEQIEALFKYLDKLLDPVGNKASWYIDLTLHVTYKEQKWELEKQMKFSLTQTSYRELSIDEYPELEEYDQQIPRNNIRACGENFVAGQEDPRAVGCQFFVLIFYEAHYVSPLKRWSNSRERDFTEQHE